MKKIVPYELDLANTWEDLYAHVHLENVDIGPGDSVLIQQAPTQLAWGEKYSVKGDAVYTKASIWQKIWTRFFSRFEITMLYEVSFSATRYSKNSGNKYPQQPKHTYSTNFNEQRRIS
jgi:hypothetical protein